MVHPYYVAIVYTKIILELLITSAIKNAMHSTWKKIYIKSSSLFIFMCDDVLFNSFSVCI